MSRPAWILLKGNLSSEDLSKIEKLEKEPVFQDKKVETRLVDYEELNKICSHIPEKLPKENLRVTIIE